MASNSDICGTGPSFGKGLALVTKHPVPTHSAIERELLNILKFYPVRICEAGISASIMSFSWFAIARLRRSHWNTVYLIPYRRFALFSPGRSIGPSVSAIKDVHSFPFGHRKVFVCNAKTPEEILLCKSNETDVTMTDRPGFGRFILEND